MSLSPSQIATLSVATREAQPPLAGTSGTLRHHLADIDGKIACQEAQLKLLYSEKRVVSDALSSIVYPVLTIPPELTTQIFEHFVHRGRASEDLISNLLTVASVCRAWRTIAVSCGALWNHVSMHVGLDVAREVKLLQMWLSRSGDRPLHVDLRMTQSVASESLADAILPLLAHWPRCKSLRLCSTSSIVFPVDPGPFWSLKKVDIDLCRSAQQPPITAFLDAPLLREAHVARLALPQIALPWGQLTGLHLALQTIPQCLDILGQTPNLEILSILRTPIPRNTIASVRRVLRHLHRIECSAVFLNHLILPILDTLSLVSVSPETAPRVKALVNRSGCTLRVLRLNAHEADVYDTFNCITSVPSIRTLSLTSLTWDFPEFQGFFHSMEADKSLLELKSLNLQALGSFLDVCSLADMLSALWTDKSEAAKLESFSLSFTGREDADFEDAMARLRKMRREGLEIDIRSAQKWTSQYFDSQMISEIMK
ncbi:hypothetical protein C8R47DRAFT_1154081 [Mycena vitilis]|nr:hypothetical protein C8R47DRAFT_1154081 [Mycena vitilis]